VILTYPTVPLFAPDGNYYNEWVAQIWDGGEKRSSLNETQVSLNTTIDLLKDVWTVKADVNFRFNDELENYSQYN
jgi:hypothetical protein